MAAAKTDRTPLHTGGCQCGAVRFAVYVQPEKIGLCHCRMCQKAVAGPFAVLAEVPWADFAWTRGEPAAFQSSSRAIRDFCAGCGTPLSYRQPGGAIIELLTGAFDEPAARDADLRGGDRSRSWRGSARSQPCPARPRSRTAVRPRSRRSRATSIPITTPDHPGSSGSPSGAIMMHALRLAESDPQQSLRFAKDKRN